MVTTALSSKTFPSHLLDTDSGPHGSLPRAQFVIEDCYPEPQHQGKLMWHFLLGRRDGEQSVLAAQEETEMAGPLREGDETFS